MQWPWSKKKQITRAEDQDVEKARELIDAVIYPLIKKQINALNKHLEKDGIRVGIEINWFFDKVK
jgi:hypothetical protein